MADLLRDRLRASGWQVVNKTCSRSCCFVDAGGVDADAIVHAVNTSGRARDVPRDCPPGATVIRAAITNYKTTEGDIDAPDRGAG